MQEQFVTYEIALALKELGFDEECFAIFFKGVLNNGHNVNYISVDWNSSYYKNKTNSESNSIDIVSAPLWQQVIDWFREKHNIHIGIVNYYDGWAIDIRGFKQNTYIEYYSEIGICLEDYYEVREQAISKTIELCKNNL